MKKRSKVLKVISIVLLVVVIVALSLIWWQWKNIKSIYMGVKTSADEITQMRGDNQEELRKELDSYLNTEVRELSDEEKEKIESGEISLEQAYHKIFTETYENVKKEAKANQEGKVPSRTKPTKEEIISKYIAELYLLQSEYTAQAEAMISSGASYFENLKKTQKPKEARTNTITHFTPKVRALEAECNSKVEAVISNIEKELVAIGEKTDITVTIRKTYENEKQFKLSYYANKYLN